MFYLNYLKTIMYELLQNSSTADDSDDHKNSLDFSFCDNLVSSHQFEGFSNSYFLFFYLHLQVRIQK